MENITIETTVPLFDGFYNSVYEFEEERILEGTNLKYDELLIDYEGYVNAIGKEYTAQICDLLKEHEYISNYEYEKVVSPKYYNYSTDSIYCKIEFSMYNIAKIKNWLKENWKVFEKTIKEKFTSCSGFHSFYSNSADIWYRDFLKAGLHGEIENFKAIQWCTILEIILQNDTLIDYDHLRIYEDTKENVCELNYYDLDYENITPERLKEIEVDRENN